MAGISDAALGKLNSQNKFNGGSELEEDYGINLYSTFYRRYDPQIGRFSGVDALADLNGDLTPYRYAFNDPLSWNDPSGLLEGNASSPATLATVYINMPSISVDEWDNFVSNRSQNDESSGGGGGGYAGNGEHSFADGTINESHASGIGKKNNEEGPGDKNKNPKKPSKAKTIINNTLKTAAVTIIAFGGPEDPSSWRVSSPDN